MHSHLGFSIHLTGGLHGQFQHGVLLSCSPHCHSEWPKTSSDSILKKKTWPIQIHLHLYTLQLWWKNFPVYHKGLLLSPISLCKTLRRWMNRKWPSGLLAGSSTLTSMSSGHMDQIGSWPTWMAYMVTSNSPRRYRKKSTYLFSTMTSTGDHNLYQKPTHTHLYRNPESHHQHSNIQAIFSILM